MQDTGDEEADHQMKVLEGRGELKTFLQILSLPAADVMEVGIEASEDGQAVYRLAHQLFTDHYRSRADVEEVNGEIAPALSGGIEGAACRHGGHSAIDCRHE